MVAISEIGKFIKGVKIQGDYALARYSEIFAKIEQARDTVIPLFPFQMDFKVKRGDNRIQVSLWFIDDGSIVE